MQEYSNHGVHFTYPETWTLEERDHPGGVAITLENPEADEISFWTLILLFDAPEPADVLESTLQAFRDDYSDLDEYPASRRICGRAALARDLEFVFLELINSAAISVFQTDHVTAMVLYQGTDHDLAETRPIFEQITSSLRDVSSD